MKKLFLLTSMFAVCLAFTVSSCKNEKSSGNEESSKPVEAEKTVELKPVDQKAELSGKVDVAGGVHMTLTIKGEEVEGTYYYDKMGEDHILNLKGTLSEDGILELFETTEDNRKTGHFIGYYGKDFGYKGNFASHKGLTSAFELVVDNVEDNVGDGEGRGFMSNLKSEPTELPEASIPTDDEEDYEGGYSYDEGGSGDWDELLDAYERYVDKIVSLSKKMNSNDPSAIQEYAECMEEASELSDRLSEAQTSGSMSAAQIERLNRIARKYEQIAM